MPPDQILLRWLKYNLRRTCWKGYQYRRKVENFRDDLRDGVAYLVLLKRILPKGLPAGESAGTVGGLDLENEIDPNVRLDTIAACASSIDPPARSVNTYTLAKNLRAHTNTQTSR